MINMSVYPFILSIHLFYLRLPSSENIQMLLVYLKEQLECCSCVKFVCSLLHSMEGCHMLIPYLPSLLSACKSYTIEVSVHLSIHLSDCSISVHCLLSIHLSICSFLASRAVDSLSSYLNKSLTSISLLSSLKTKAFCYITSGNQCPRLYFVFSLAIFSKQLVLWYRR